MGGAATSVAGGTLAPGYGWSICGGAGYLAVSGAGAGGAGVSGDLGALEEVYLIPGPRS